MELQETDVITRYMQRKRDLAHIRRVTHTITASVFAGFGLIAVGIIGSGPVSLFVPFGILSIVFVICMYGHLCLDDDGSRRVDKCRTEFYRAEADYLRLMQKEYKIFNEKLVTEYEKLLERE